METTDFPIPERPDNNGRKVTVGFLLRESFGSVRGKTSGWEFTNLMNRESPPSPNGHVYDQTDHTHTMLYKRFLRQDNERFTADFRIQIDQSAGNSGSRIAIRSEKTDIAALDITDCRLSYIMRDGTLEMAAELIPGAVFGLRLDINLKKRTLDVWVNGKITNAKRRLTADVRSADGVCFYSTDNGRADFTVHAIEMYKGFSLYENLFITPDGNIPENWKISSYCQSICDSYDYEPMFRGMEFTVFRLSNPMVKGYSTLIGPFRHAGSGDFQFDFFLEEVADDFCAGYDGLSGTMDFFTQDGNLYFKSSAFEGDALVILSVREKVWYRIQVLLDCQAGTLTINTNGFEAFFTRVHGDFLGGRFHRFMIANSPYSASDTYIDRICVKPMIARRSVPKPVIPDTGKTIVNMQVCNLWREGTHFGWDLFTKDFKNRKPILGWYDEGDPEVADWEIKWALEHGIQSFMYCWYRPNITYKPFKQGRNEDQLWEGYFNSAFKDDFKFTVMLTNHATSNIGSEDDMLDNIMPYFIETFFKNPNYLKTSDNKPIMYIYQMSELLKKLGDPDKEDSVGTPADVKRMFDRMREMTRHAGFGGLLILGEYRGKDPAVIKNISDCGYDYCFAYTWHPECHDIGHDEMLAQIKDYLLTQRKLFEEYGGTTKVIPNLSVSWDPTAWNLHFGRDPGKAYTFDLAHLEELLRWAKDEFGTPELDNAGHKMMMIDNWNEYGEGHYFLPAYGTPAYDLDQKAKGDEKEKGEKGKPGFGWLDCIRKVYVNDPFEHKDLWPLEEGFGPYDKWFPPAWEEEHVPDLD